MSQPLDRNCKNKCFFLGGVKIVQKASIHFVQEDDLLFLIYHGPSTTIGSDPPSTEPEVAPEYFQVSTKNIFKEVFTSSQF